MCNIICIKSFLTIQTTQQHVKQSTSSKSLIKMSSNQSIVPKNFSKHNLRKTQKKSKRKCYQINNENEILLFMKDKQYNFNFSKIKVQPPNQHNIPQWIPFKNVVQAISQSSEANTSLIVCHNYSDREYEKLLKSFGKQLICSGYIFDIHFEFGDSDRQEQRIKRNIGQVYELEDVLACKCFQFDQILVWFKNPKFGFGFLVCNKLCQFEQFEKHIEKQMNKKMQKLTVFISTLIQQPTFSSAENCLSKLKSCQGLKQKILKHSEKQKEPFSFRNMSYEPELKSKSLRNSFMKSCEGLNKNKKMQLAINNERTLQKFNQGFDHNRNKGSSFDQSSSSSESDKQNNRISGGKQREIKSFQAKQFTNILVENVNMKWEIKVMKQQFESQAAKYIEKTTTKYQNLKQERTYWLQENSKLRKENDQILIHNNSLKMKCEHLSSEIQQFKNDEQERIKVLFDAKQGAYEKQIVELTNKLSIFNEQSAKLKEELTNAKFCIEDGRKRTRERVQQLQCEIDVYKQIIQQMKIAYEELEKEHTLEIDKKQFQLEKIRRQGDRDSIGVMGKNRKGRIKSSGVLELQKQLLEVIDMKCK